MATNTKPNTPSLNALIGNATPKNNTPKNNASKTGNAATGNISNANLNKEISNILGETTPSPGANNKTAAKDNNNNNNNNNNNLNELLAGNIGNASKGNKNKSKAEAEEPSMVEKGIEKLGDTFSNIKNSILGEAPTRNNTSKNTGTGETKDNRNQNKRRVALELEPSAEHGESMWMLVVKVVIMVIALVAIYYIGNYLLTRYMNSSANSPILLNTTKNAKNAMVISQDPTSVNYIPILKSDGQDGIQLTYGFWFLIESMDYKPGEWKHVFHKGNSSSYPNRAPGVWFHPNKNSIRVYMNTQDNILEYADVDDLPIRKWVYMNIILNNKNLDLYINGYLKHCGQDETCYIGKFPFEINKTTK